MGGTVDVESTQGFGSTFTMTFKSMFRTTSQKNSSHSLLQASKSSRDRMSEKVDNCIYSLSKVIEIKPRLLLVNDQPFLLNCLQI